MSLYRIPEDEIGGARVVRPFDWYKTDDIIPREDIAKWPQQNWSAMVNQGIVELIRQPQAAAAQPATPIHAPPADSVRVVVPREDGAFDVIEGVRINSAPLGEAEAEALAEYQADAARSGAQDALESETATEQPQIETRGRGRPKGSHDTKPRKPHKRGGRRRTARMTLEEKQARAAERQQAQGTA